ncbi:ABC transporter permease subunit [Rhizobium sp. Rhizsp82]|uniref:ABC transporter permease subunit n=1 Tax=Rhizobium sp. Rhizsp82 TaxID=3243057 RepID=UPI0039B602F5
MSAAGLAISNLSTTPASGRGINLVPAALLIAAFLWIPLITTVISSLQAGSTWSGANYSSLFGDTFPKILLATLGDSAAVTLACLFLGVPTAYTLARVEGKIIAVILFALSIPLFVSSLIRSYSWVAILGNRGLLNQFLLYIGLIERPIKMAYTQTGMFAAMVQVQLPLFILPAYSVMRRIDPRVRRAAQSLGADPITAFFTAFLPLAMPGIGAASLLVFIGSLGFFETPAILGPPGAYLVSQSIEVRVNSLGDQGGAAAQAVVLLLLTVLLLSFTILLRKAVAGLKRSLPFEAPRPRSKILLEKIARSASAWRWMIVGSLTTFVIVLTFLPLIILLPLSLSSASYLSFPPVGFSFRWFIAFFETDEWTKGTALSIQLAAAAAAIATFAGGLCVLNLGALPPRARSIALIVASAPLVISPMVLAVSIFYISALLGLIGNPVVFIGTYALMGLPFPVLIIGAALTKLDPALLRAAASLGAKPSTILKTVTLPLLSASVLSGFLFSFVVGFNDLSVSLFLSSGNTRTLPLLMWDDVRQEITPRLAAVSVVVLTAGTIFWLLAITLRHAVARRRADRLTSAVRAAAT